MHNLLIKNIEKLCGERNISINKVMFECNLNKSIVDNLKKGSIPSIDKIFTLCSYFDVSIDWLTGRCDNPNSHKKTED